jgi:ATP-dependent Clp protease ATP-binding subunit ClpA
MTAALTPRCHRILGAAGELALAMGQERVGVEHLFLAIIRDRHAVSTQVLGSMTGLVAAEARLRELMGSQGYLTGTDRVVDPRHDVGL